MVGYSTANYMFSIQNKAIVKRKETIDDWQDERHLNIDCHYPTDTPTFCSCRWHITITSDLAFFTDYINTPEYQ